MRRLVMRPAKTIERLSKLPNASFIRGNADRYLVEPSYPIPTVEDAQQNPELVPVLAEVMQSFSWTQGVVYAKGWMDWLAQLPLEYRFTLPDGTRVLLVHASPGSDVLNGMYPNMTDAELEAIVGSCEADLIFVGHTHWAQDRQLSHQRMINVGCISNPFPPDLRASYVMLEADSSGHQVEFHRVEYDQEAVIQALHDSRHPAPDYIIQFLRGQVRPHWIKDADA